MTIYRDQLEAVYRLIEDPKHWTQGAYARTADGEPVPNDEGNAFEDDESAPLRDGAACWCLFGAGIKCGIPWLEMDNVLEVPSIVDFNDNPSTEHADVLNVLKDAIERAPVRP